VATEYRADEPDPEDDEKPYSPGIGVIGHVSPYFPYDPDDPRAPIKEKRKPGFVTEDDYVQGGVVKQYKSRRSPKRANRRKR
jgi:hypothetical protein